MIKPNLPPFKNWALQNFPFIEDDFDAITNYQLYCKIVEYMKSVNTYMQEVNTFLTEVQNYFNNLDVQEEINNKLDQMASDGTLTNLISIYLEPFIEQQNAVIEQQNISIENQNQEIANQNQNIQDMKGTVDLHSSQIANLVSENNPTEGNSELIDIRVAYNGETYLSAGNSVRSQAKHNLLLSEINSQTIKNNNWNKNSIEFSSDLFEIGGINTSNGTNVTSTLIIRTKSYLNFNDIFRYLYVTEHTTEDTNMNIYIYELDGTYVNYQSISKGIPFQNLTSNKKYRLALVDETTVTSVATTLAKFDFELVSYIKLRNDIYNIDELNLINPNYAIGYSILDSSTGYLTYNSGGNNSSICIPIEAETQYYCDNANFYTAFFDENMDLIGSVHYTGHSPLTSPFTTPEGACYMAKSFRTADIESSAFISKSSQFYSNNDILIEVKNNVHNKPILENNLPTNVLNNKTINVYGDSISSTDYTLPYWGSIIAESTGCTINNYGISGTTLAHTNDRHLWDYHFTRLDAEEIGYVANDPSTWWSGNCFCERFIKVDDSADGIVIMGGTNDSTVQLGTWNSTDTTTFYGALNVLLQGISERMAGKKILVCTPIQTANSYSSNVSNASNVLANTSSTSTLSLQLRAEAIKEKCKQYGINCLDLYNMSGINGVDDDHIYYRSNDNLHPSSYGQVRIATLIQSALEDMFRD